MCTFRNSKIMGCLPTRVRWISYKMKEIGLLISSNTLAAQRSQYVCLLRLSTWSVWKILFELKCLSLLFFLPKPGPQKRSAKWVADVSQLVFGSRNTPGQHWRLQEGKESCCPTMSPHSSKSIKYYPKLFVLQTSSNLIQRCCPTPWPDSKQIWTLNLWTLRATLRSWWSLRYNWLILTHLCSYANVEFPFIWPTLLFRVITTKTTIVR